MLVEFQRLYICRMVRKWITGSNLKQIEKLIASCVPSINILPL